MEGLWRLWRRAAWLNMPLYAAGACYFLALSLFPGLLLVLALVYRWGLSANDLIVLLEELLPGALLPWAEGLIVSTCYKASAAAISLSALAAVWSASRGFYGLMAGLRRVYGVRERGSWLRRRLASVLGLGLFLLLLLATLTLRRFRRTLLPLLQILSFTALYASVPQRGRRFLDSVPGAVLATLGWQSFTRLFGLYVLGRASYAAVYGSVYAVALGLVWLYCCVLIVLFGGAVNRFRKQWK